MRKSMKKLAALLLSATLCTGLFAGCAGENTADNTPTPTTKTEQPADPTATAAPTEAPADPTAATEPTATPEPTATTAPTEAPVPETDALSTYLKDLNAIEVTELMGNGINLGNTMEAYGRATYGVGADTSKYETTWGQPVTTQEMVNGMKAAGFDTLRVPVAWTNAMNYEDGDYTINQSYLDRVGEIIDYAINADMFVIVNDHWDGGWWGMFGSATEVTRNAAMDMYIEMWTQIAKEYGDRSYKLIFESGNEELGNRLNDKDVCADSGSLSEDECYATANKINQAFVDTIRSTGGNNADRFLLIAGINTNIANTCDARFQMPTDTVEDKLLLSVHYYDPSNYCIFTSVEDWGTKQEYQYMNDTLAMLKQFTEQGVGVVIGEWGVLFEGDGVKNNRTAYMENYLDNCDLYGYCPVLWDCNNLYNRYNCAVIDEYKDFFTVRTYEAQSATPKADLQAKAQADIAAATEAAPEAEALAADEAVAWIMYTSSDWGTSYSVGDIYTPGSATAGLVATDVPVTGEGSYTVALDFTGTAGGYANGVTFCAVDIGNGELLFPGYVMNITSVKINGEEVKMNGLAFTTSDDGTCTRVNLYNAWVTAIPEEGRTMMGKANSYCTPCPIDQAAFGEVKTIEVTFNYVKK